MDLIELHIIQSFPVTCLNRDDLGAPKTAYFGGVQRARVSSQSWKRAIRFMARELNPNNFAGQRTRYILGELKKIFAKYEVPEQEASVLSEAIADALGKLDNAEKGNVKTLLYISPMEIENVVKAVLDTDYKEAVSKVIQCENDQKAKPEKLKSLSKSLSKAIKSLGIPVKDNADVALFGRMVADDHSLMLEGAACFSHAISTHKVSNEIDFFSAVDDIMPEGEEGAGHIGTLEFNSACYYRYININLDLLKDKNHLAHFSEDEIYNVLTSFIKAALMASPTARKNSQFGYTLPGFVLGLRRTGQPLSLANAFENPIKSSGGVKDKSVEELKKHYQKLRELWNIKIDKEVYLPPTKIDEFIDTLIK